MADPALSIVIVNWKSKDYLRACLGSVAASASDLTLQIIVVDGASFDGCGEMLAAEFPHVEFIQSHENIGFGGCNNLGAARATAPHLLLLNPDTLVPPGALQSTLAHLRSHPEVGLAAPRLLNTDGSIQTSCVRAFPTPVNQALDSDFLRERFPSSQLWGTGRAFASTTPTPVDAVSGACMMLPTHVFRQVGGFSPEFFMYGEDMDLCKKIRLAGYSIIHLPHATVTHHGGASSRQQVTHFSTLLIRDTNVIYLQRHHGHPTATAYRSLQIFSALARLTLAAPVATLGWGRLRSDARITTRRWWAVLQWCFGVDRIGPRPARPGSGAQEIAGLQAADANRA
jgi:GT2 family glycosyltransferase